MTAPHDETLKDPAGDQQLDVVVVGGSQAGLAMAWHLAQIQWSDVDRDIYAPVIAQQLPAALADKPELLARLTN
jgi:hypothetical protein